MLTLAGSLLADWDGVGGLARAEVDELARTPGVGSAKASRLVAAFALASRINAHVGAPLRTSADLAALATVSYTHLDVYKRQGYAVCSGAAVTAGPPVAGRSGRAARPQGG